MNYVYKFTLFSVALIVLTFGQVLSISAQDVKTLIEQGNSLKDKNDYDGAIKLYQQALTLDKNSYDANIGMSAVLWMKKDYANAKIYAEKAAPLNPKDFGAWNMLGLIARDQKDFVNCVQNFQKVVEILPKANISFANLAYCSDNLGKTDEAIANYTKAIEIANSLGYKPESYMYGNRGAAYRKQNKFDEAIADYRKALEIDPNNQTVKENLDWALKNRPQTNSGTTTISAATAEEAFNLGMEVYKKHEIDNAIAYFTKAIELNPKYMMAYGYRGLIYEEFKKDKEKARADYLKVLELEPNYPDISTRLGVIDHDLGYYDEAIDAYTKMFAFTESATKPDVLAVLYTFRGLNYSDKGSYDQAIADFQKAIQLDATFPDAYDALGTAYKRKNDYDKAIASYNKAIELNPNFAKAYTNRGLVYFYKADYAKALADYNKAIQIDPQMSSAYNNRAAVYDAQDKPELEIADYKKAVELDPKNDLAKNNLEIATSVLGDGTSVSANRDVRFINAAIRAAERAYDNGSKMPTGELACRNLFNSYLMLSSASDRLSSLRNGIQFGSVAAPKVEGGNSLEGFAADLARIKARVFTTGTDIHCDFVRVVR